MKRFICPLIAAVAIVMAILSSAPKAAAQFRYGPMVGANFTSLKFRQDLFSIDSEVGPAAGIAGEMMFPGIGIGLDLGLLYQMRGSTLHMGQREIWASQGYGKEDMDLHMVSIPIHLKLKWHRLGGFEEKLAPIFYVGPTFSFMAGHSSIDAMKFSGGDVAIDLGIGAEIFRRWQITGGYSFGMTYLAKAKILTDFSCRANSWNIRLAYYF
ncbi:MAG: porin family protein [Pseudoflavonifractor sp.]|nr:porin family protein [Alloprevotella sp.]MCM1116883.1 porin family protein [Pseudoflavonifractor sp.]